MGLKDGAWLRATRQRWKLVVAVVGSALALASFAWFVNHLDDDRSLTRGLIAFAGAMIFTIGILFAIRCPSCGHRPVWRIWRTEPVDVWVTRLFTLDRCPSCRRTGEQA